jgi:hypothetical protein
LPERRWSFFFVTKPELGALRPDLEIYLSPELSSSRGDYRRVLRARLADALALTAQDRERLRDLSVVPRLSRGCVSISHCRSLGGWAYSSTASRLGFDIEQMDRARPEVVVRQGRPEELKEAPHPAALWTAKEAAFKYLFGDGQPLTAKAIEIGEWSDAGSGILRFSARFEAEVFSGYSWSVNSEIWAGLC